MLTILFPNNPLSRAVNWAQEQYCINKGEWKLHCIQKERQDLESARETLTSEDYSKRFELLKYKESAQRLVNVYDITRVRAIETDNKMDLWSKKYRREHRVELEYLFLQDWQDRAWKSGLVGIGCFSLVLGGPRVMTVARSMVARSSIKLASLILGKRELYGATFFGVGSAYATNGYLLKQHLQLCVPYMSGVPGLSYTAETIYSPVMSALYNEIQTPLNLEVAIEFMNAEPQEQLGQEVISVYNFLLWCQYRQVFESKMRKERGVKHEHPVMIPGSGVPRDEEVNVRFFSDMFGREKADGFRQAYRNGQAEENQD